MMRNLMYGLRNGYDVGNIAKPNYLKIKRK